MITRSRVDSKLSPTMRDEAASLLLVTHVAIRQGRGGPQIDDQTAAGIAQWCKHFDQVTYFGIAHDAPRATESSSAWVDIADNRATSRCKLVALPRAYRPRTMAAEFRRVRAILRRAVATHRHLCFTFSTIIGDWPAVAAREAIRQGVPYAAWLDRVEPDVISNKLLGASLGRRLVWALARPIIEHNIRFLLDKSAVALLQGLDTYERYAVHSHDPNCTYDTHTHVSDQIPNPLLVSKQARILSRSPIRILYVGRAAAMKGPGDWLDTLEALDCNGVPFQATWIGDGPELQKMKDRISRSRLASTVHLHGFEGNRDILLGKMQESDIFLFCHKTAESSRCLIEALVSGCALVGYETAYPRGLVYERGGGLFTSPNDSASLADLVIHLDRDRAILAGLIQAAAASGKLYNEDTVYAHRAHLMKRADKDSDAQIGEPE